MPSYSSRQFTHDWRYAVESEFCDANDQPFVYADDGKRSWGDELESVAFNSAPQGVAINADRTLLAICVDDIIHLYNANFEPTSVLRGHTSRVDVIAFQPGQPHTLISCSMDELAGSVGTEPTILFWNLKNRDSYQARVITDHEITSISSDAAESVRDSLAMLRPPFDLSSEAEEKLLEALKVPITHSIARSNTQQCRAIHGRITAHFQSEIFSPSGKFMIYLPDSQPRSNGDDQWDIKIYSMSEQQDVLTLSGHRDAIMWTGYDSSEKLIGTAAWDKTFRIWDAETGQEKYRFATTGQNWTAGFSPDSRLFAGTTGDGSVHVYSLDDGSEMFQLSLGKTWCRALDWSPDSKLLVVGAELRGKMVLIDIEKKGVVQTRILSTAKAQVEEEPQRSMLGRHYLTVSAVKFADEGRKLIFWTSGDDSAEAYDLVAGTKWRFAREGTQSYEDDREGNAAMKTIAKTTVEGGHGMVVWDDLEKDRVMIATIDHNAVRIWSLKMGSQ